MNITWEQYFGLVQLLSEFSTVKLPSKQAQEVLSFLEKFDAVLKPLSEWQRDVLMVAEEVDRTAMWEEKMDEEVEIPTIHFSEYRINVSPSDIVRLRAANLW